MTTVTKLFCIALTAMFLGTSTLSLAADPATAGGVVVLSDHAHAKVTVVKVNKKTRELTLRNAEGEEMTIVAGKEVRNFKQIKKGDVIEIDFHVAAASALKKVDDSNVASEATEVARAPAGAKPGAAMMHTSMGSAEVLGVDSEKRILTVKGKRGNIVMLKVPAEMKSFDELKPGDHIAVEYTEAMAISVKTPPQKSTPKKK
jgi:hypothetical protein